MECPPLQLFCVCGSKIFSCVTVSSSNSPPPNTQVTPRNRRGREVDSSV